MPSVSNVISPSQDEVRDLTDGELLEAIRRFELVFKSSAEEDSLHDHRRHLSRVELETVYSLVRRRAQMKIGFSATSAMRTNRRRIKLIRPR